MNTNHKPAPAVLNGRELKGWWMVCTPCEGVDLPGYYSESKEAIRQSVNNWIRTSGSFDAIIDFDAVLRDPDHPSRLLPHFASEDNLHPTILAADAIDLAIFKQRDPGGDDFTPGAKNLVL
jgi:hypothetical protein